MIDGRDGLTGLLNRRSFEEVLNQAVRDGRQFTLVLADIAGFKRVNDRFGMRAADEVLRAVAGALLSIAGGSAARVGPDEFAVVVADPDLGRDLSTHLSSAADVRVAVGDFSTTLSALVGNITVAVGTATAPDEATDAAGLCEIAYRRLRELRGR